MLFCFIAIWVGLLFGWRLEEKYRINLRAHKTAIEILVSLDIITLHFAFTLPPNHAYRSKYIFLYNINVNTQNHYIVLLLINSINMLAKCRTNLKYCFIIVSMKKEINFTRFSNLGTFVHHVFKAALRRTFYACV